MESGLSSKDVSKKLGIAINNVRNCLHYYSVLTEQEDVLKKSFFLKKSQHSKNTRANISPEAETRRLEAIRGIDWAERNAKMSIERKGSGNPMYGKRFTKQKSKCPHCPMIGAADLMKRWHFDNCKHKV